MVTETGLFEWLQRQDCLNGYRDSYLNSYVDRTVWLHRQGCLNGYREGCLNDYRDGAVRMVTETGI